MNKIIFFDIDGILITEGSNPSFVSIAIVISKLKKQGIIFGINTNRPWVETRDIYKKLKLNGPIILENGAVYKLSYKGPEILINFKAKDLNKKIIEFLNKILPNYFPGITVLISNDKSSLRQKRLLSLISKNRNYTSSIYMRNRGRVLKKDLSVIMKLLKEKFPQSKKYIFKEIPDLGKIVASNDFYDRIKTMDYVRNRYFSLCELFFISDEERVRFEKNIKKSVYLLRIMTVCGG